MVICLNLSPFGSQSMRKSWQNYERLGLYYSICRQVKFALPGCKFKTYFSTHYGISEHFSVTPSWLFYTLYVVTFKSQCDRKVPSVLEKIFHHTMNLFHHTSQQSRALFCHTTKLFHHTMKLFCHTTKLFCHTSKMPFCVKKLISILGVSDVFGVKSFVGEQITSLGTRGSFKALALLRSAWASN